MILEGLTIYFITSKIS